MIVYVPKSPVGRLFFENARTNRANAWATLDRGLKWQRDQLKQVGWRIVRCELTEVKS